MALQAHIYVMLWFAVSTSLRTVAGKEQPMSLPECANGAVVTLEPGRYVRDTSTQIGWPCTLIGQPGTLIEGDPGFENQLTLKGVMTFDGLGKGARFGPTNVSGDSITFKNMQLYVDRSYQFVVGGGHASFEDVKIFNYPYGISVVGAGVHFQGSTIGDSDFRILGSNVSASASDIAVRHSRLSISDSTLLFSSTTIESLHGFIDISRSTVNFIEGSIAFDLYEHNGDNNYLNLDSCNASFANTSLQAFPAFQDWPTWINITDSNVLFSPDCSSFDNATIHSSNMQCIPGSTAPVTAPGRAGGALATVIV